MKRVKVPLDVWVELVEPDPEHAVPRGVRLCVGDFHLPARWGGFWQRDDGLWSWAASGSPGQRRLAWAMQIALITSVSGANVGTIINHVLERAGVTAADLLKAAGG
jgi:hypothetical protein